jgi:carbon starvation protein
MTIPIAVLIGMWMRYVRPGKVLEASLIGLVLLLLAVWGGSRVAASGAAANWFTLSALAMAVAIIIYGYAASALPVLFLLAPRDYLSTFIKLGTIAAMAVAILFYRPALNMPPLTRFTDGTGPIFAGKVFPFAFITIACGAVSGFHSLISSGTTPKLIRREDEARMIGYGAMMCESFVAIMATIAACVLQPGVFFAVNSPAGVVGALPEKATALISSWGFSVNASQMADLARTVGEKTLFNRAGGAPSLALGLTQVFAHSFGGSALAGMWYHFAIMFEALFILTVLDAGTRVGRFMVQEALGHAWKPMGRTAWYPSVLLSSALMVGAWGYFLVQGVRDPLGGINSLWPLFGIANQLLAAVALCVATTIVIKARKPRYALVTLAPLAWLVTICFTAGWQKIFSSDTRIGFLSHARTLAGKPGEALRLAVNDRLDALVTALLLVMVAVLLVHSVLEWISILRGNKPAVVREAPYQVSKWATASGD